MKSPLSLTTKLQRPTSSLVVKWIIKAYLDQVVNPLISCAWRVARNALDQARHAPGNDLTPVRTPKCNLFATLKFCRQKNWSRNCFGSPSWVLSIMGDLGFMIWINNKKLIRQLLLVFFTACLNASCDRTQDSKLRQEGLPKRSNQYSLRPFTCDDLIFHWQGRMLKVGDLLGSGQDGKVYEIIASDQIVDDLVVKVMAFYDFRYLQSMIAKELKLADELDSLYVKVQLRDIFRAKGKIGGTKYAAFLIKQRVNGFLFDDLINPSIPKETIDYQQPIKSFLNFRRELAEQLLVLSKRNIFVWDLHAGNIMYDVKLQKWFLIDAEREEGFEHFFKKMQKFQETQEPASPISLVYEHFKNHWNQGSVDRSFFEDYIDYYLGYDRQSLEELAL